MGNDNTTLKMLLYEFNDEANAFLRTNISGSRRYVSKILSVH